MFYRVTMDLFFNSLDEAADFYHDGEVALPKSVVINPGQPDAEHGSIILHSCGHGSHPSLRCTIIKQDVKVVL